MASRVIKNQETKKMFFNVLKKHFEEKMTYEEIAKLYKKSKDYIYCLVKAYKTDFGIPVSGRISYYNYLTITDKLKHIVEDYNNGLSTATIGEKYGVTDHVVASWLKNENVSLRNVGKVSKIDQDIFDNIDSEVKAYTLGLIMSDGNVSKEGNTISITLTQDDSYVLEDINERLLNNKGNICISHKRDKKPRKVLQFNGKKIKERLADFYIIPDKSHNLIELPSNIPKEFYHHFIRGLYDGDGVCAYYTSHGQQKVRIGFCAANKNFVENYQKYFIENFDMKKTKIFNTGGCWQCSWGSVKDLQTFFDYIYKDATIFLGRKYKKLNDFLV